MKDRNFDQVGNKLFQNILATLYIVYIGLLLLFISYEVSLFKFIVEGYYGDYLFSTHREQENNNIINNYDSDCHIHNIIIRTLL